MKRRLPITNQGESVLAATNLPPVTADTNLHRPSAAQPGSDNAASHAAPTAAQAHSAASAAGATAAPPSSTANAANATATRAALALKRRHHPRAVL